MARQALTNTIAFIMLCAAYFWYYARMDTWQALFAQYQEARRNYARTIAEAYGGDAAFDAIRHDPHTVKDFYFRAVIRGR